MFAAILGATFLNPGAAHADPLPADYSGTTHGDAISMNVTAAGQTINAALGHSATAVDSTTDPRAHAESANLDANAVGIPVSVVSDEANSNNDTPTDSYNIGLGQLDVPGLLDTGLVTGSGFTNWEGDYACVPDGVAIAQSSTSIASTSLGISLVNILDIGTLQTTGQTTLQDGSVVSTSSGNLGSLSLIGGAVQVQVQSNPVLTATSDGTTGSVSANDYGVSVTAGGTTTVLQAGQSRTITIPVGVATANLTISVGSVVDSSSGPLASGSLTFLNISGSVGSLASFDIGLLPLRATALAPEGGVECDALDPPVITAPADDATTSEFPTIEGTGIPGATVTVSEGDTVIGTAVVDEDGNWSLVPEVPFSPGEHTIEAVQELGGSVSEPSDPVTFNVLDENPPDAPVITSPTEGEVTNNPTPTITGTGEPGATVEVTIDDVIVGTTVVDEEGNWSLELTEPLAEGEHTVTAIQNDQAGNVSPVSEPVTFQVDTTAPDAPVITSPTEGELINDPTPTIEGTGEPGATVEVTIDGEVVGTAVVDEDGNWSLELTEPLADGEHTVTATQTDEAGNVSPASEPVTFQVDTAAPDAPVITSPTEGEVTSNTTPTIEGTGEPGATVEVSIDGEVVGTAVVDEEGNWSLELTEPLADGEHTVTATQTDEAGNVSPASEPVTFEVDTTALAPVITAPGEGDVLNDPLPTIEGTGEPGATVEVSIDGEVVGTAVVDEDGNWSLELTEPLADGEHTVTAIQTDEMGNVSPASDPITFQIDTAAPDAPVITNPVEGEVTNDPLPTIEGTGEPGATVEVTIDDVVVGTAVVDEDGNWSLELTEPLADGEHTVTATQTDEAGNVSAASEPVTFQVDTTAPDAPVITAPEDGAVLNDPLPTITGTGEPGATVEVTIDGEVVGTVEVDEDGNWSLELTEPLADGEHTVTATQTDEAGNVSPASDPVTFQVDTTAPDVPEITSPTEGELINDPLPTITGTGEPGATVEVTIDGEVVGTAVVDEDGNWSLELTEPLADGEHTVTATQTDEAGNVSPASEPVTFEVDTTALAPVITAPEDGAVLNDPLPTITGTGEPGATVEVTIDDEVVGTAVVDEDGNWSLELTEPLADGEHTVTAIQTDEAGNVSPASDPVTFQVDTTAPDAPVITSPTEGEVTNNPTPTIEGTGEPGATVEVTIDGEVVGTAVVDEDGNWSLELTEPLDDGEHTVTAIQTDEAGNVSPASDPVTFQIDATAPAAPVVTAPEDGAVINDPLPTISGTGEPGATVEVSIDGEVVGTAVVDEDGNWSLELTEPLSEGEHTVTATQTDEAGNVSPASEPITFQVDTVADAPVITSPTEGALINDATPTITGTGEPGATVEVTIDGEVVGTAVVDEDGNWSLELTEPLSEGEHTVTATQTDEAGNVSPASDPITFQIDTTAPDAPVVTSPTEGEEVTDATPTISGTGEPGATVEVSIDGEVVGTAVVDEDGNWSLELTEPLSEGEHTVTATQTDEAGNVSPASEPVTFIVNALPPDAPVITSPTEGEEINDSTPTISGTGEPGATVEVSVDGEVVGTVEVDEDGNWSLELTEPLAEGEHTVTATQTDASGQVSPVSEPVTFSIDTTAPAAPVITNPQPGDQVEDRTPRIDGTGESGATVEVSANGRAIGTAAVGDDGTWSFTPADELACGAHGLTATQTDAAGNTSPASEVVAFAITCAVPAGMLPTTGSPLNFALVLVGAVTLIGVGILMTRWRRGMTDV